MEEVAKYAAELGAPVFVTFMFLLYLYVKNGRTEKIQSQIAKNLELQTRVLIKVARSHGLEDEAEDLMLGNP